MKPTHGKSGALGGLGLALGVALSGGLAWWLWQKVGAPEAEVIDEARVVVVTTRDVIDSVNATGNVEPKARVAVMSRASGIIERLAVEAGDVVAVGQVLVELDREQLQAQLAQDEADRLAAAARLAAARARVDEARVRAADPEPEFLEREAARLRDLHERGNVSVAELDAAERAHANAAFRVELARANLPVLEASVTEAEAQLAATVAAMEQTNTELAEATILCPIDGLVLTREKEVGDGVSSILTAGGNATEILTLGDVSEMYVEARIDEVDLGRIELGMPAIVTVDAYRGKVLEGQVRHIAPAGSVDLNGIVTFEVEVSVADPDKILKPDMTADARLVLARTDAVPTLPQIALSRTEDGGWSAERIAGTPESPRLETVQVEVGLSDGLMTEITGGLELGDRVLLPIALLER